MPDTPDALHLSGKTALVTGGSRNIGRETALALGRLGADVIVTYNTNAEGGARTVADLEGMGRRAKAVQANLTGTDAVDELVGEVRSFADGLGRSGLDILVNNAGTLRLKTFDQVTQDDLDAIYRTNYKSVFFLTQALAEHMSDGGRIVNLGSGTARIAFAPLIAYGPFKAALQSLTLYWASHLGGRGITVNAVAPGGLDDDFNGPLFEAMPQARDFITGNTALGRIGVPTDIAGVIAFLCRPEAGFVSGAVIPVDGGYHL